VSSRLGPNQIARRQHALVTRDQAVAAGLSHGQIRRRNRSGEWSVVRPGVYAITGAPPTRLQSVAAVALCAGPAAWISHQTAAALWGVPGIDDDGAIHVVTGLDRRVRLDGVRGHRSGALFSADVTTRHGIPVLTPARALVDVSATVGYRCLGRAIDDLLRRRVMTLASLRSCIGRLEPAPGRRLSVVHELLGERLPGYDPGDSDLETRVLRLLVANGFSPPVQQHRVRIRGRSARIDLAYPGRRLAIELDGWEFHHGRTAFDDDRARANLLVAAGWTLVRFTSRSSDAEILECLRAFGRLGAA
jgi:very-short-patch-repair endonuclease